MLAYSDHNDAFTPSQLFAGDAPVTTEPCVVASGEDLEQHQVVARLTASGKIVAWDPTDVPSVDDGAYVAPTGAGKAIGILVHAADATEGDLQAQIYTGGCFNRDKLVWPEGATAAQKAIAFDGTPISVRGLPGSTTSVEPT